ncbi:hypothetical protein KCU62_g496, partial [Aureobasidium sp. EXF-3399]
MNYRVVYHGSYCIIVLLLEMFHIQCDLGRGRSQRLERTILRVNLVVGDHAATQMMINMADNLPQTSTSSVHHKSLADTVVDRGSVLPSICILVAIAVHVEYVGPAAISHDVPEYFVALAHLKDGIVGEGVAIDGVCQIPLTEGGSRGKVFSSSDVKLLRIPDGTVGAVELCDVCLDVLSAHDCIHGALCIDDGRTNESRVCILVQ